VRPLRTRERGTFELFGDHSPDSMLIRGWMKTAVRKEVTSFGAFLSTCAMSSAIISTSESLASRTRGTREVSTKGQECSINRQGGTPLKTLFWVPMSGGRWRIDWQRTNRGA